MTQSLIAAQITPDGLASDSFHQRVLGALSPEKTGWEMLRALLRGALLNRRVALPVVGATVVGIAALTAIMRRPDVPSRASGRGLQSTPHAQPSAQAVLEPDSRSDPPPSIANYAMVATHSLEKLDELLTRQGNRNPSPTRIYRASNMSD